MSNKLSLSEVIQQLKAELIAADRNNSDIGLSIAAAEVSIRFEAIKNELGDVVLTSSNAKNSSQLNLKFAYQKVSDKTPELSLIDDDSEEADDFDSFKKRFEDSVNQKHGKASSKKKSIFDCE